MNTSSDARNPVELLAEDFLERKRRGENPTLREYVERHPELAAEIRDLFPALLMMEDLGADSGGTTGSLAAVPVSAPAMRLQRLGDYRILREIGRGGMGVVYEAEQESLGRRVALKVLSAGSLADDKQARRFEREAKAAARLHHTNIVPVFGVGRHEDHHYFVMQYIAGRSLDVVLEDLRRLRQGKLEARSAEGEIAELTSLEVARSLVTGQFAPGAPAVDLSATESVDGALAAQAPPVSNDVSGSGSSSSLLPGSVELSASSDPDRQYYRSVARIGIQVAEALEYANRQGVLHRDVKPSNLLLDNHGNVWVADFGLAKTAEADDLTHTGDILGTIRYMAPERFSGRCDARSDVYSLGLTLYELLALRPAYEASDRHALIERVLHEEPARLKKLAPGVPRDLETIVAKAMAREPGARYETAAALADDLGRFVEDRPIRARRVSAAERFGRWCRRNKVLASSIGVAAAALVAVAALSLLYADRQTRHANEQAEANKRIAGLARNVEKESFALKEERGRLKSALSESRSRLAQLDLERGRAAFDKGEIGVGMLWTVESLKMATEAEDQAARHVALANLSAWRRSLTDVKQIWTHNAGITAVAFSPDSKTVATASWDSTARLWSVATGEQVGPTIRHGAAVRGVSFSPDGRTLAAASNDKTARLWDVTSGKPVGPAMTHPGLVFAIAYSPDGRTLVTGCNDGGVRLWNAATGRELGPTMHHQSELVWSVAFSPDGKTIASAASDNTARLWDVATGRQIGPRLEHTGWVYGVSFSRDGKILASAGHDKTVRLWDAVTGRALGQAIMHDRPVVDIAFSPDGQTIVTGSNAGAQVWDVATGQAIGTRLGQSQFVSCVAFSPDGRSILTGADDSHARLWNGQPEQPAGLLCDFGGDAGTGIVGLDGKSLITAAGSGIVRTWDVRSGRLVNAISRGSFGSFINMVLSPDGTRVLTCDYSAMARIWDTATGRQIGPSFEIYTDGCRVALSPDGKIFAVPVRNESVQLRDAATGQPIGGPIRDAGDAYSLAFSPDGTMLLTGGVDNIVRCWEVATGRLRYKPTRYTVSIATLAFSPDGKTVLVSDCKTTTALWDITSGQPLIAPLEPNLPVVSAAVSPDGRFALTGLERRAQLWDVATGRPIGPPIPPLSLKPPQFSRVQFTPDGQFLVCYTGPAARIWAAPPSLPDDLGRLSAWVEAMTGLQLDARGSLRVLDRSSWLECRRRLDDLGGSPSADQLPLGDPVLMSDDPAARGAGWNERGLADRALTAYLEAVRARPLNPSTWRALARFQAGRGQFDQAAATLLEAITRAPDDLGLRGNLFRCMLATGNLAAWREARADLVKRYNTPPRENARNDFAWVCVLGPDVTADFDLPVHLAELAVQQATVRAGELNTGPVIRAGTLSTLGAALYRAGRFEAAIQNLEECIRIRVGTELPQVQAFLAMAYHRLGRRDLALLALARVRSHQPSADPAQFWSELEIRLLRAEAEAVILYDPVFPADSFAR